VGSGQFDLRQFDNSLSVGSVSVFCVCGLGESVASRLKYLYNEDIIHID
jgi:hypothetical protein